MPVTERTALRALGVFLAGALLVLGLPQASLGASATVTIRDNSFNPREVRIDPGDLVIWTNQGSRVHDVKSDERGQFASGNLQPGERYSHRFMEEGYYFYHCTFHGARGRIGMWGVVIVGNPPPPPDYNQSKSSRPRLVVPDDFPTIQKAVNQAAPGSTVVIKPGVYRETVHVTTPDLVIQGVDRFRTVLNGQDKKQNGFIVDGVKNVTIRNLTVRNYLGNGIYFYEVDGYTATRIDAIKNRTYGIYAFRSYHGVFKDSFGYGSGDSAFYIGECLNCSGLIENVTSKKNYLGYSGTNATGVVIRKSRFIQNGAGVVPNTLPTEDLAPNRGTVIFNNVIRNNNYETIPAAGFSETVGIPFGTGVWLPGVYNHVVRRNRISNHKRYGVLITPSIDPSALAPMNNRVWNNMVKDSGIYDLAWDGSGANNCFGNNTFKTSGPPDAQTIYNCSNRPFAGVPYPPITADVAASLSNSQSREQKEPREPKRPRCQRGRPGCNR
jgi:plastocyanin